MDEVQKWHVQSTFSEIASAGTMHSEMMFVPDSELRRQFDIDAETQHLEAALAARKAPTVLVSNEVGSGIVPDNAEARRFRDLQGRLNQRIAARADRVVLLVAGLPMVVKG